MRRAMFCAFLSLAAAAQPQVKLQPVLPSATIQYPQSRETTPQPTIAYGPGQMPLSSAPPPQWSPMPPIAPQKRTSLHRRERQSRTKQ